MGVQRWKAGGGKVIRGVDFFIEGKPQPKARARTVRRHGITRTFTPESTRVNAAKIAGAARDAMYAIGEKPFTCPLKMILRIYVRPSSDTRKDAYMQMMAGTIKPTKRPDLDNYMKQVMDALNGVVYLDDSQIVEVEASKIYAAEPRIRVIIFDVNLNEREKP